MAGRHFAPISCGDWCWSNGSNVPCRAYICFQAKVATQALTRLGAQRSSHVVERRAENIVLVLQTVYFAPPAKPPVRST